MKKLVSFTGTVGHLRLLLQGREFREAIEDEERYKAEEAQADWLEHNSHLAFK